MLYLFWLVRLYHIWIAERKEFTMFKRISSFCTKVLKWSEKNKLKLAVLRLFSLLLALASLIHYYINNSPTSQILCAIFFLFPSIFYAISVGISLKKKEVLSASIIIDLLHFFFWFYNFIMILSTFC